MISAQTDSTGWESSYGNLAAEVKAPRLRKIKALNLREEQCHYK